MLPACLLSLLLAGGATTTLAPATPMEPQQVRLSGVGGFAMAQR
eukprot:COSAG01_NODE_56813_length_316_cov_0.705069_1_plen_43_part_01